MAINDTPKIRERAISYARNQAISDDISAALATLTSQSQSDVDVDKAWVQLRIGVDNMIANGFEIGYQAAVDDSKPVRSLGGTAEARARAARVASKASKAAKRRK